MTSPRPSPARSLLVSSAEPLIDAVAGLAAAAGSELTVVPDVGAADRPWSTSSVVMVDAALVEAASATVPGVGAGAAVVVVGVGPVDDPEVWRHAVRLGAEHVVELPDDAAWLIGRLRRARADSPVSDVTVVMGAAGGVGVSTLAAALARHAAGAAREPALVDLDPGGGGLDLLLGAEHVPGARWDELLDVHGPLDERLLVEALPLSDGVRLLTWSPEADTEPVPATVGHVLDALCRRPSPVVVDAGRSTGALAVAALARARLCVLVVPLRVRAVVAAQRLVRRLPTDLLLRVVCTEPSPGGLAPGDVAAALEVDVVDVLPFDRRRAEREELGVGAPAKGAWADLCAALSPGQAEVGT